MDLALNNLQRLICHKTKQTKPIIIVPRSVRMRYKLLLMDVLELFFKSENVINLVVQKFRVCSSDMENQFGISSKISMQKRNQQMLASNYLREKNIRFGSEQYLCILEIDEKETIITHNMDSFHKVIAV